MPKRQRVVESDDDEDDAQETFSDSGAEGAPDGHGTGGDAGARGRAAVSMTEVVRAIHFRNQRNAPRESDDISSVVQLLEQLLAISSMGGAASWHRRHLHQLVLPGRTKAGQASKRQSDA